MGALNKDLFGEPEVSSGLFGGNYVTIDGKKYEILRRSGDNKKWIVKECEGILSGILGDEKVIERDWAGHWRVRNKGWSD